MVVVPDQKQEVENFHFPFLYDWEKIFVLNKIKNLIVANEHGN